MTGKNRSGIFVVIEGPDASGKETQTGLLVEWLRKQDIADIGREDERELIEEMPGSYPDSGSQKVEDSIEKGVWRLSFPTYGQTPGGRVVEAYLDGSLGQREDIPVGLKADIYAADRKQFREMIRRYLSKGGIIVCDRYREANLIHQLVGFEGEQWRDKLNYLKSIDEDLPDADEVFYLHISPEEAAERLSGKEKDIHELDDEYMRKSNRNGRKVADHEDWQIVEGERGKEEVFTDLKERFRDLAEKDRNC